MAPCWLGPRGDGGCSVVEAVGAWEPNHVSSLGWDHVVFSPNPE